MLITTRIRERVSGHSALRESHSHYESSTAEYVTLVLGLFSHLKQTTSIIGELSAFPRFDTANLNANIALMLNRSDTCERTRCFHVFSRATFANWTTHLFEKNILGRFGRF